MEGRNAVQLWYFPALAQLINLVINRTVEPGVFEVDYQSVLDSWLPGLDFMKVSIVTLVQNCKQFFFFRGWCVGLFDSGIVFLK